LLQDDRGGLRMLAIGVAVGGGHRGNESVNVGHYGAPSADGAASMICDVRKRFTSSPSPRITNAAVRKSGRRRHSLGSGSCVLAPPSCTSILVITDEARRKVTAAWYAGSANHASAFAWLGNSRITSRSL